MTKQGSSNLLDLLPRKGKTLRIETSSFPAAPPVWFGLVFLGMGMFPLFIALKILFSKPFGDMSILLPVSFFLLFGGLFAASGLLLLYLRLDIPRNRPLGELSKQLGVSEAKLRAMANEQGIVPRYNIVGRDFYRAADFDATSLLRAASAPFPTDELLRAAQDAQTTPNQLVRATSLAPAPLTEGEPTVEIRLTEPPQSLAKLRVGDE